jgi:hypothetical protein
MKIPRTFALLSTALIILPTISLQANAELFDMVTNYYPKTESLDFNNLICEVKNVYQFEDDSTISKISNDNNFSYSVLEFFGLYKDSPYGRYIGENFIINRKTGKYKFDSFGNHMYENIVLDIGSKKQSFKVISKTGGPYIHTQYIEVDVFEDERMNFKIFDFQMLFTGICKLD